MFPLSGKVVYANGILSRGQKYVQNTVKNNDVE